MKASYLLIVSLSFLAALSTAQTNSKSVPANFPLFLWTQHKQVTQIPWTVSVGQARYRSDLRQELEIRVAIRQGNLEKSGDIHDLTFYYRVLNGSTPITSIHFVEPKPWPTPQNPRPSRYFNYWEQVALVRPGKYKLEVAVFDRATGLYSTGYENVTVSGNENNPLEMALRSFPSFEFVEMAEIKPMNTDPLPRLSIPKDRPSIIAGGGAIPRRVLTTRDRGVSTNPLPSFVVDRPSKMNLSVISILSPPERVLGNDYSLAVFQNNLTDFLWAFSRLDVANGTAKLTGVDLSDRTIVIDRVGLKEVTREMLNDAINKDMTTVSVNALSGVADRGRFLRDLLRERLKEAEGERDGTEHVIILVAARSDLLKGSSASPLLPEQDCHCRVFHVRFAIQPLESDDIDNLLKAYKPQILEATDWQEFRKNFATIYEQLLR